MHGFYKANGGCGYIKKPDFLVKAGPNNEVFDPKAVLPVKKTLKVIIVFFINFSFASLSFFVFDQKLKLLIKSIFLDR